jgi:hypothetical protein
MQNGHAQRWCALGKFRPHRVVKKLSHFLATFVSCQARMRLLAHTRLNWQDVEMSALWRSNADPDPTRPRGKFLERMTLGEVVDAGNHKLIACRRCADPTPSEPEDFVGLFRYPQPASIIL